MAGSRRLRVLHLIPWAFSGGVETRRLQLLKRLPKERFEQEVMCLRGKGPLLEEMQEHARVKMHNTRKRWKYTDIEAMAWIAEEVSSWKPDIIHGAVFEGTVMAGLAGVQ